MKTIGRILAMTLALSAAAPATSATSRTGDDPVPAYLLGQGYPKDVADLERAGRFKDAEALIGERLKAMPDGDDAEAYRHAQERLERVRREFSLSGDELIEKLKSSISDVSSADLETWRKEGVLQWLLIDGELRYFRREPANLFRFSEAARKRRDAAKPQADSGPAGDPAARRAETLAQHAAKALATAKESGTSSVLPVRMRASHTITVKPGNVPKGETIRCWMPFPKEYRQQGEVKIISTSPAEHRVAPNDTGMRTVYMEQPSGGDTPTTFSLEFEYKLAAFVPSVDPDKVEYDAQDPAVAEFTKARLPHVPIDGEVATLAAEIVGPETNPYRKAEKIWLWMQDNIKYSSEMEYCIIPSAVGKIMAEGHGDCGIQALMFIALCRASGVAARWQSGWVTRPGAWNMHDWAEFYAPPYGWLPADPSIGFMRSDEREVKHFLFGNMDAYRMIANTDFDTQFDPPKDHWRSDPVDNQRGEVEWSGGNLYYDDWEYRVRIEHPDLKE